MLAATIVYMPGSAGMFLYRVLTLSERTITGTTGADPKEYSRRLTAEEKFERYNNWDGDSWITAESTTLLSFKCSDVDYYHYVDSDLALIDYWHPNEFLDLDLWTDNSFYQYVILIDSTNKQDFLIANQQSKHYNLDWAWEKSAYDSIREQYQDQVLTINFDDFFDGNRFIQAVKKLDQALDLELNYVLVEKLWTRWYNQSLQAWKK